MKELTMIYREVLSKRLKRKRDQLDEIEKVMKDGNDVPTSNDKRKFIELKAVVQELENVLDIADTMFESTEEKEK